MEKKIIIFALIFMFSISFASSTMNVGDDEFFEGINIIPPTPPINYSLFPTVNSSDWWNGYNVPTDIPNSEFWVNDTLITFGLWNSIWVSTYNSTYDAKPDIDRFQNWSDGAGATDDLNTTGTGIFGNLTVISPNSLKNIKIHHDNSFAYIKWDDSLRLITDTGTNTNTYVDIRGKGTGIGYLYISDQDNSEFMFLTASNEIGYLKIAGSSPVALSLQNSADVPIRMFENAANDETQELQIYGFRDGDQSRSLQIGVGTDADDTASFDGVSNYYFDGNLTTIGTLNSSNMAFEKVGDLILQKNPDYDEDFVFGSYQLNDTGDSSHDVRMFLDKSKYAFRAGRETGDRWNDANVGQDSVGFGYRSLASGVGSAAFGSYTEASNTGAASFGSNTVASGDYAVAMGYLTKATGVSTVAMGYKSVATGEWGVAMGGYTVANSRYSTAFGTYNAGGGNPNSLVATDPLFEIGSGTALSQVDNVMTILKNHKAYISNMNIIDPSSLGNEKITNGGFWPDAEGWTLNTGWTNYDYTGYVLKDGDGTGTLLQTSNDMVTPLVIGEYYRLSYRIWTWDSGIVIPACGGVTFPQAVAAKYYVAYFRATTTDDLIFTPSNTARFIITSISLKQITDGDLYVLDDVEIGGNLNVTGTIINDAIYAQLSDLNDQVFATANVKQPINLTTTDEINGLSVSEYNITILTAGVYSIFAQPQVTAAAGQSGVFHMWLEKHDTTQWLNVSNSNVELSLASQEEDVIPLIVTIKLNANEQIRVMGSVSDTDITLDAQVLATEPTIPSIIFTMYRIGS